MSSTPAIATKRPRPKDVRRQAKASGAAAAAAPSSAAAAGSDKSKEELAQLGKYDSVKVNCHYTEGPREKHLALKIRIPKAWVADDRQQLTLSKVVETFIGSYNAKRPAWRMVDDANGYKLCDKDGAKLPGVRELRADDSVYVRSVRRTQKPADKSAEAVARYQNQLVAPRTGSWLKDHYVGSILKQPLPDARGITYVPLHPHDEPVKSKEEWSAAEDATLMGQYQQYLIPAGPSGNGKESQYLWHDMLAENPCFEGRNPMELFHRWHVLVCRNKGTAFRKPPPPPSKHQWLGSHENEDWVWEVRFSPDGTLIASAADDQTVRVWNAETGERVAALIGHSNACFSCDWSADGARLVSASKDGTARLWDLATEIEIHVFAGHRGHVQCARLSHDGGVVATASHDKTLRVWDAATGACLRVLAGHKLAVLSCDFAPPAAAGGIRLLASGSRDHSLRLWNVDTGEELMRLKAHLYAVNCVAWSPVGLTVASVSDDRCIRVWPVQLVPRGDAGAMALLEAGGADGKPPLPPPPPGAGRPEAAAAASIFDQAPRTEMIVAEAPPADDAAEAPPVDAGPAATVGDPRAIPDTHRHAVTCVAWSADGAVLATASVDKSAKLWRASDGSMLRHVTGHSDIVRACAISPDGSLLATGSADETLRVWPVEYGALSARELEELPVEKSEIDQEAASLAFVPEEKGKFNDRPTDVDSTRAANSGFY